jgi:prepilin signal peptidase PulO-like enzyme (type II secretory pathway)
VPLAILLGLYVAVLGLMVGSYLNVVVYRLPRGGGRGGLHGKQAWCFGRAVGRSSKLSAGQPTIFPVARLQTAAPPEIFTFDLIECFERPWASTT